MTAPNIVTYTNPDAKPACVGYIVLPDGNFWGVRFEGETPEVVRVKAGLVWATEQAKWQKLEKSASEAKSEHHFAGKVWMINRTTHDLRRVDPSELSQYEAAGYVRGGPRVSNKVSII